MDLQWEVEYWVGLVVGRLVFGVTHQHNWKFINLSSLVNSKILVLGLILSPKLISNSRMFSGMA